MRKDKMIGLFLMPFLASGLVGCQQNDDFSFSGDETYEENSWTELYKEHNIIPEFLYSVDSSQAETKLSTAIMSGEYPDILSPDSTEFLNYVNSDVVADIRNNRYYMVTDFARCFTNFFMYNHDEFF